MAPRYVRIQVEEMRRLRQQGKSVRSIARQLGTTPDTVRRYTEPEYAANRQERARIREGGNRAFMAAMERSFVARAPEALYVPERDGIARPRDLTGLLMGDPPPGRRQLIATHSPIRTSAS